MVSCRREATICVQWARHRDTKPFKYLSLAKRSIGIFVIVTFATKGSRGLEKWRHWRLAQMFCLPCGGFTSTVIPAHCG